ncbi:DsbA family protein [Nocardioides sp. DS6]|uniref:DsbA family protein n=1 Tax=Nocardioides eburneus TaxID=3231482 RepID=A0ABV3T2J0_9ACTN
MASKSEKARERAERAAATLAAQKKREQRRRILSIVGVVVAIAVIIGVALGISLTRGSTKVDAPVSSSYDLAIGPKNAPHTVVIYEDFLCPYCQAFESASRDGLAKLAADGKVRVEYRPFHFLQPDYSLEALNAFAVVKGAYPTGDVAKKFHDLLYENQPDEQGPFPSMDSLVDLAVQAGAEKSKVEDAIKATDSEQSWTDKATAEANNAGVQSTPTVLLDGKLYQQGTSVEDLATNLIKQLS